MTSRKPCAGCAAFSSRSGRPTSSSGDNEGALKLLEINPRISSSTSIRTAFGYNECAMAVEYYLEGKTPKQPVIRPGRAVRYTEDLIFYS